MNQRICLPNFLAATRKTTFQSSPSVLTVITNGITLAWSPTQLPGSPFQHFTNHYSVTFIVLKYWPLPGSHASPPKPSRLLAVCFSVKIQRGYEAKRFSLKKNGTRLVRVSPHSLLDHSVLLRSRYNSSLKPKLPCSPLVSRSSAPTSGSRWLLPPLKTAVIWLEKTLAYLKTSN